MKAGWEVQPLGDVCNLIGGGTPSKKAKDYYGGTIPWVTVRDMNVETIEVTDHSITEVGLKNSSSKVIPKGEVIIASRVGLGKVCKLSADMAINQDLKGVIPKRTNEIDRQFLFYWFQSVASFIEENGVGATVQGVKLSFLNSLDFPVVPLEEQKRIVAVLDAAFEGLTRAKENAEANLQNARELFEAGFEAQLESSDAETVTYRFGDTAILEIIDGDRGNAYPKKSEFMNAGYCLFLSTKNVREDGFKFDDCQFVSEKKDSELRKGKLRRRDVVLTTRGTIGNIGLYNEQVPYDQIRINSGMLILRPHEEVLSSDFLFEALRSRVVRSQIAEQTSGAAQPQLPIRTLRELSLVIPKSLKDQATLVSSLRAHQDGCRELEASYCTKLTYVADLRQSLLQKAFAGELT